MAVRMRRPWWEYIQRRKITQGSHTLNLDNQLYQAISRLWIEEDEAVLVSMRPEETTGHEIWTTVLVYGFKAAQIVMTERIFLKHKKSSR